MKNFLTNKRTSGVLAHITSLPSPFGIGDLGPGSRNFLKFLQKGGQKYWQVLPVGPTNTIFDNSPYMSTSAFAGSPHIISPELLWEHGLISRQHLDSHSTFSPFKVEFAKVIPYKSKLLKEAFSNFSPKKDGAYDEFIAQTKWLEDYALFMVLKNKFNQVGWEHWPEELAAHKPKALAAFKKEETEAIRYFFFEQFEFHRQWQALYAFAQDLNIHLFGDLPIYVGFDSADVWANQEIFALDPVTRQPVMVAGVPPDYFSNTGQRWGNPLYRWQARDAQVQEHLLAWWIQRFAAVFSLFDIVRIDHFRGFDSYWSIPAAEETAINGRWIKGPGKDFFKQIFSRLGRLDIVAEDLGDISLSVIKLKNSLGFPGMKILQFAFDGNPKNAYLPYNFTNSNCVVYTGTHDNDTTVGWFMSDKLSEADRNIIKKFANRDVNDQRGIHHGSLLEPGLMQAQALHWLASSLAVDPTP